MKSVEEIKGYYIIVTVKRKRERETEKRGGKPIWDEITWFLNPGSATYNYVTAATAAVVDLYVEVKHP